MTGSRPPTRQATPAGAEALGKLPGGEATGVREALEEMEALGAWRLRVRRLLHETPCWLTSMVVHLIILLMLALLTLPAEALQMPLVIASGPDSDLEEPDDWGDEQPPEIVFGDPDGLIMAVPQGEEQTAAYVPESISSPIKVALGKDMISSGLSCGDPLAPVGPPHGPATLREIREQGPPPNSPEAKAVAAALRWLAAHQLPDGGWCFNHGLAPGCGGKCRHGGDLDNARLGATGLALLPFLGAGQTHQRGHYRSTVGRGLYFLISRMELSPKGGALNEPGGRMYSHGIASIALCEAYAMTHDRSLHDPAQQAINFICYAQHPVGGGWRYEPQQRGDTSVVGWQIMALKSGHMAYLSVPPATTRMAEKYLDGVQYESGAKYGYTDPGQGSAATTSIGLLCRMYLGWKKDNPALARGVQWISRQGPANADMYYNYYATQVMRHWGGLLWREWDKVMKNQLIDSQATAGHEKGSWYMGHSHADRGGRLYCTTMAAMVLEVYYRHLPIYRQQSVEVDFPE